VQQIANEEEGRTNHPFWLMIVAIRKAYGGRDNICGAQGLGLDDRENPSPLDESGEDAQREPRGVVETAWLDPTFDVERQLLVDEEILGGQARV
jgi:hypothetical protein